jgi:F0F1-type ATP synthase membrane subunit a
MRTFMRNERGRIDVLLGFVIVVVAVGFAIYECWIKENATLQPDSTQSQPKTVIDGVRDKVNDAMEKQMSRIPVDEPTAPASQ